jgi:hypothetical protein
MAILRVYCEPFSGASSEVFRELVLRLPPPLACFRSPEADVDASPIVADGLGYHFKSGNGSGRAGLRMFYPAASCGGKSVLVRQLRGPHLSTWPWCSKRSSMALTAAASPSSLPQSSTGRFEVSMVLARS